MDAVNGSPIVPRWRRTAAWAVCGYLLIAGAGIGAWLVATDRASVAVAAIVPMLPLALAAALVLRPDPDDRQYVAKLFACLLFGPALGSDAAAGAERLRDDLADHDDRPEAAREGDAVVRRRAREPGARAPRFARSGGRGDAALRSGHRLGLGVAGGLAALIDGEPPARSSAASASPSTTRAISGYARRSGVSSSVW